MSKQSHDALVYEVEAGLARFISALREAGADDAHEKARLFRGLEAISRESAKLYEDTMVTAKELS